MFALKHIQKGFDNKIVLDDINFALNAGEVVALIGENGAGKTTLLKVMLTELKPDSGTVALHHETIGYLPQELPLRPTIQANFDAGTEAWRIDYALALVGLESLKDDLVARLSGGQKTRLGLARVLAQDPEPTILLLDEPTNNLDAEGLVWLEDFIRTFHGSVVLVSHDRSFINKVCTKVAELQGGKLKEYGGNYDFYKAQKEREYQTQLARYQKNEEGKKRLTRAIIMQKEKSQHTHNHIRRPDNDKAQRDFFKNRVATKFGRQAKVLETRMDQLEEVQRPSLRKDYKISLRGSTAPHKLIVKLADIGVAYGRTFVLQDMNFEIRGSERLHIKGANGTGKTTLLKLVAGGLQPDFGERKIGKGIHIGYFSQDINGLNHNQNGFVNLQETGVDREAIYRQARGLGLTEKDLQKLVRNLSRGQQAKLAFAKLLLNQTDLLILDEPTNHLDISTREKIEAALQSYSGAMLLASHDSYFVETAHITQQITLKHT